MLSVVIPAHDEVGSLGATVAGVTRVLEDGGLDHEVLVADDGSSDGTGELVASLSRENPRVRGLRSPHPPGFGFAVRAGLEAFRGDAVAVLMAVTGYPRFKLVLNRMVNLGIRLLFRHGYNDTTNAFKAYRRGVIEQVQPLLSHHFNLTVELPLKAVVRGFDYAVVPISWRNRTAGTSKLLIQEMGSRYAFIVLYVLLEHHLSRGDYRRRTRPGGSTRRVGQASVR